MLLTGKNAVVYGASGHIGSAVARAFAREGAMVFLAGRTQGKLDSLAEQIGASGGTAMADEVDALDLQAVERHLAGIVENAGSIDISFNAIWIRGDLQGTPLIQMRSEDFTLPIVTGVTTHFLTATAAARYMVRQRSGTILTLSSSSSALSGRDRRFHTTGGFSTACAAIEAFTRSLAGEVGRYGVRAVCLRPDALPETWPEGGDGFADVRKYMQEGTALDRMPTVAEVANAAVFAASDLAAAVTGTVLNLTCGSVMD